MYVGFVEILSFHLSEQITLVPDTCVSTLKVGLSSILVTHVGTVCLDGHLDE